MDGQPIRRFERRPVLFFQSSTIGESGVDSYDSSPHRRNRILKDLKKIKIKKKIIKDSKISQRKYFMRFSICLKFRKLKMFKRFGDLKWRPVDLNGVKRL